MKHGVHRVESTPQGEILRVRFENADGDSAAAPVGTVVRDVILAEAPAGLILDFTDSGYVQGDGICGVVVTVARRVPAVVLTGPLGAPAIERTLRASQLLALLGGRVFLDQAEALASVRDNISAER